MITEKQKKQYITNGGVACPKCGEYDIVGGMLNVYEGIATQSCHCANCGEEWTDIYKLYDVVQED